MSSPRRAEIVVGIDGSSHALAAVDVAAREAALRGCGVRLARAITWPMSAAPLTPGIYESTLHAERQCADDDITAAQQRLSEFDPSVEIAFTIEVNGAAQMLLELADHAEMLVVGAHGRSDIMGVLAGSTAVAVATHASTPVLIARGHTAPAGDIIVGVDDAPSCSTAIEFAFEEARLRETGVQAVHASAGPAANTRAAFAASAATAEALTATVAGWAEKYPDVPLVQYVTYGRAKAVMVEASSRAQLVVVGARGRGGLSGLLLGSVGQTLIHRSMCPVAIVRPSLRD
jgi:nucleotide-binding universal stress UspA family protein